MLSIKLEAFFIDFHKQHGFPRNMFDHLLGLDPSSVKYDVFGLGVLIFEQELRAVSGSFSPKPMNLMNTNYSFRDFFVLVRKKYNEPRNVLVPGTQNQFTQKYMHTGLNAKFIDDLISLVTQKHPESSELLKFINSSVLVEKWKRVDINRFTDTLREMLEPDLLI